MIFGMQGHMHSGRQALAAPENTVIDSLSAGTANSFGINKGYIPLQQGISTDHADMTGRGN